jgi:fucose 4-O-acetylase-like acetyltransferase
MSSTIEIEPISRENSRRIDALRFLLVVAIVVIHARSHSEQVRGVPFGPESLGGGARFLQEILSSVIARTAVPLFFLFSGFLTAGSFVKKGYGTLLKSRARTLLTPYLIWNLIAFSLYCVSSPDRLGQADLLAIFGANGLPAAYHFWFIRDLILLVIAAPLFVSAARIAPWPSVLGALALWFYSPSWMGANGMPIDPAAICFFLVGVALCFHRTELSMRWQQVAAIAYAPLAVADAILSDETTAGIAFHKVTLIVGMVAIWYLGGVLIKRRPLPAFLTGSAFMVYAAHEPLLSALKKISYFLIRPDGDLSVSAIYLLTASATVVACIVANALSSRWMPRAHAFVTGGR